MNELIKVNHEQRLYVTRVDEEYISCIGFDNAFEKAAKVAQWMGVTPPNPAHIGTEQGYAEYQRFMRDGGAHARKTDSRCPADLHPQLVGLEGEYVAVTDQEGQTYAFRVGKSTGWFPIHLECESSRWDEDDGIGGFAVDPGPFLSVHVLNPNIKDGRTWGIEQLTTPSR